MAEQKKNAKSVKKNDKKKNDSKVLETSKKEKKVVVTDEKIEKKQKKKLEVIEEDLENVQEEDEREEKDNSDSSFVKKHLSDIILVAVACILVIVGIFAFGSSETSNNLVELNYSEYTDLLDSGEPLVFIVERATCSHCANYMPIVKKFANNNDVIIYYIDTDTLSDDEFTGLQSSNSYFIENSEEWGTPTTMLIEGSEVIDTIVGETDEAGLKDFLQRNGILE